MPRQPQNTRTHDPLKPVVRANARAARRTRRDREEALAKTNLWPRHPRVVYLEGRALVADLPALQAQVQKELAQLRGRMRDPAQLMFHTVEHRDVVVTLAPRQMGRQVVGFNAWIAHESDAWVTL